MKRKSGIKDNEGELWSNNPGYSNMVNSPLKTPVSAKGGRTYNKSKVSKEGRSGPLTPISNAGEIIIPFLVKFATFSTVIFDNFLVLIICRNYDGQIQIQYFRYYILAIIDQFNVGFC